MYIYDQSQIIDNFRDLKSFKELVGTKCYETLIHLWGTSDIGNMTKVVETYFNDDNYSYIHDLISLLAETSEMAYSVEVDDLIGIYVGLYPIVDPGNTYLPQYYIIRCSNNGRSIIVSPIELTVVRR